MTEFSKALVERVARIITQTVHRNGSVTAFWNSEEEVKETARAALTASGLDEAIEAIVGLLGGKCPQCDGWGEVAYFGEMVDCRCAGKYRHQPTDEAIARARTLTDKLKG